MKKVENKIKYSVWFRCYINGKEVFASKHLINIVRKMHIILSAYIDQLENDFAFELRRLEYHPDGDVVINYLITDKVGDLI